MLRGAAALAAESGAGPAFEFLFGRQLDANPRQYTLTPPDLAALMADLAVPPEGPGRRPSRKTPAPAVLDPASGTGALLRAVGRPAALYAQEADPDLAALTALRLALGAGGGAAPEAPELAVRTGDTLRADAFPKLAADVVLCHPPFNERNWGHDELAYDPRWEYGYPARAESELAWVQHALARLRPGGTAVLLMPPAAASRRSGRRIRADLLRRGALRAVVALPAGAAPPYGVPLHLWVLRRPDHGVQPSPELLLVDTAESTDPTTGATGAAGGIGGLVGGLPGSGRERMDWPLVRRTVLDAWHAFAAAGPGPEANPGNAPAPGPRRAVPVIELLDDEVDLTPARHLPRAVTGNGAAELADVRNRLTDGLRLTLRLTPPPADPTEPASRPFTTLGELARAGALQLSTGGSGSTSGTSGSGSAPGPVLTEHDVLGNTPPSGLPAPAATPGTTPGPAEDAVVLRAGDVVVPVLGGGSVVRVVDEAAAGAVLGRNLQLLRPDPAVLDPGSSRVSCAAPPTTAAPAATPPPPRGSTPAASGFPGSRWTNNAGTVSSSAPSPPSRTHCARRADSADCWSRACTTGSRTGRSPRSELSRIRCAQPGNGCPRGCIRSHHHIRPSPPGSGTCTATAIRRSFPRRALPRRR